MDIVGWDSNLLVDAAILPTDIDFSTGLSGDEFEVTESDLTYFKDEVERKGKSKLVIVYDCEGDVICIAAKPIAEWLIQLMNTADINEWKPTEPDNRPNLYRQYLDGKISE